MTRYLLDTGPFSGLLFARPGAVSLMRPWLPRHEATTSILVCGEVMEYLAGRSDVVARRRALVLLLKEVVPLAPSLESMDHYVDLRRRLRPPHGPGLIGDVDTIIAATALEHDLTVVTTDGDFTRVPGLKVLLLARRTFTPVGSSGP